VPSKASKIQSFTLNIQGYESLMIYLIKVTDLKRSENLNLKSIKINRH